MKGDERISGEYMKLHYSKVHEINIELVRDNIGSPILVFEDEGRRWNKELFRLHLKEAIELKGVIDKAILDWHWFKVDEYGGEHNEEGN